MTTSVNGETYAFPVSFAQQRMWVVEQLARGTAAYNLPAAWRLRGPLDVGALKIALQALVDRHESLRTTIEVEAGTLHQVVHRSMPVALSAETRDAWPGDHILTELLREETERPFDLALGPLFRCRLIELDPDDHVLLLNMHHIVSDGWSMEVLERELAELYAAGIEGRGAHLPDLPIQYADYSVWQREWLSGEILDQQLGYWREQLGALPALQLATDFARPTVQSFRGASVHEQISAATTHRLRSLGQQHGATLFMTLLAAFHLLLARHGGHGDFAIGSPVAGRVRPELEAVVGFFVNSLVIRNRLQDGMSFRQFLDEVRKTVMDALSHQDIPFEKLVADLLPKRETDRNPLFQVMFSMQSGGKQGLHLSGIDAEPLPTGGGVAKVDLTLFAREREGRLLCSLNYSTGLFAEATARSMLTHFRNLLADVVANPDKPVGALRLLDETERALLVEKWNATDSEFPREASLVSLFSAQAARTPEAIAVRDERATLSYAELERRSNQLAHHLIACGVGAEQPVALAASRSVNLVVGILGILKAGGAYLPLDADYPEERQAFMLDDARVQIVLSESSRVARLAAAGRRVVDMQRDRPQIAAQPDALPPNTLHGASLAYILYTSGSTGTPKGVCIEHHSVSRLVVNTNYVQLTERDHLAQLSNISFDAATFEIWGALLNGATLEIFSRNTLLSPDSFARALGERRISALFLTTALFNRFVAHTPGMFRDVATVIVGGEALDVASITKVFAAGKPARLLNGYGPTECTTFATWHEIVSADLTRNAIPIGTPISNTRAFILDEAMNPAPVAVVGELYLGGIGLARAYLNQPELTARKFVASPFSDGERLYRTGDRARFRADGTIEFVGRVDNQVKIRGHRIEPGEIEAQLNRCENVTSSLVLVDGTTAEEKRLIAYVVPGNVASFDSAAVRRHLKSRLPDFMLPAAVTPLREWPLTPNGKIDRAALPAPVTAFVETSEAEAPRNQTELHLCKVWENVLGVDRVGIRDDFFMLGGNSLVAVSMFDAVERLFGKRLPMDTLWYEGATVETLARILARDESDIRWPTLVEMQVKGDRPPLFCVHTMGGNLFHYDDLVKALGPEQPVYGLQARGVYGTESPRTSVEEIAADCVAAMKTRQPTGPYQIVGFSSGGVVAYEMAQQLLHGEEAVGNLVLVDTFMPETRWARRLANNARALLRFQSGRDFQEHLYHFMLHGLGLDRLRRLTQVGEAHRWAHWSYLPCQYGGEVHLFVAEENEKAGRSPARRLRPLVGSRLVTHVIPGTHGDMVRFPFVEALARELETLLGQATG